MRRLSYVVPVFALLASCGLPQVSDLGHIEEEDGITMLHYDEDELRSFVVPEQVQEKQFDLRKIQPTTSFTRVGVRWDAKNAGGLTAVQVRVVGESEWRTVVIDDQQPAGETMLYAGHIDVPRGAALESRLKLVRTGAISPRFTEL